ncbi:MAG: nucleic acid-binding protein [Clostridiales bacterium]|nr:MAG: nucleic acid-binding protein [Clostridiales bacterium]
MNKKVPFRKCIACQNRFDKKELLRIVKTNEDDIFIDETSKANGRGAYICKTLNCFEKSIKTGALNRAFKTQIDKNVIKKLEEKISEL